MNLRNILHGPISYNRMRTCSHLVILGNGVTQAYAAATTSGGEGVTPPHTVEHGGEGSGKAVISEVKLYGEVVLRFVQMLGFEGPFLPKYEPASCTSDNFGIVR